MSKLSSLFALLLLATSLHAAPLSGPLATPDAVLENARTEELVRDLTIRLHLLPHQTHALRLRLHGKAIPGNLRQPGSPAPAASFEASLLPGQRQALAQLAPCLDAQQLAALR